MAVLIWLCDATLKCIYIYVSIVKSVKRKGTYAIYLNAEILKRILKSSKQSRKRVCLYSNNKIRLHITIIIGIIRACLPSVRSFRGIWPAN